MVKNIKVSEDTQLHMSTTYTRNGVGSKKNVIRSFSFVIKGLLISTTLVGSILTSGVSAFASENTSTSQSTAPYNVQVNDLYKEETAIISNLKMATKVLEAAIQRGELNASFYENVTQKLNALEALLLVDGDFKSLDKLNPVLKYTDKVVKSEIDDSDLNVLAKRAKSIEALEKVQDRLGIPKSERYVDKLLAKGVVVQRVEAPEMQVLSATVKSKAKTSAVKNSVIINGVKQNFKQGVVIQNKVAHIPVKETLEKLGAKVTYNSKTKQLTVVKDRTTVVLTIGKDTALVNKKVTKMGQKVFVYKGVTVAPVVVLNFFNCKVSVDAKNVNVNITFTTSSAKPTSSVKPNSSSSKSGSSTATQTQNKKQVVNGITVDYGTHTYGVKNQAEYNKVMEIVRNELKRVDKEPWIEGRFAKYYDMYLNGDRKENYKVNSLEYRGMFQAEQALKDLVDKKVSKEEIKKIYKTRMIAAGWIGNASDPRTGKPQSAYDTLVNKVTDCDAMAQVYSAFFDALGYNTMILVGNNHADAFIQIGDNWYEIDSMKIADMTKPLDKDD